MEQEKHWIRRVRHDSDDFRRDLTGAALFLCIAKTSNYSHVGLILSPSPSVPGCLERVGKVVNVPRHWYDHGETKSVTII